MRKNTSPHITKQELSFMENLRTHPELCERFEAILNIIQNQNGSVSIDKTEEALIEQMRHLGKQSMSAWAETTEKRLAEDFKQKETTAKACKKKVLKLWSVFGLVSVCERIWSTERERYVRLLPEAFGITPKGRTKRLERVLTDFGCEHSFMQAARQVREHYGFTINTSAVRNATLAQAQRAEQQLASAYKEPFRVLPPQGVNQLIAEVDGTMICTILGGRRKDKKPREWKEMRLAAAQALGKVETVYAAGFVEVEEIGRRWGHCARDAGWAQNSRIHAVGDGAEWIRLQAGEIFGKQGTFLCDFFHVSEYLAAAAETCRPEAPKAWRKTQQKRLKRNALPLVLQELEKHWEAEDLPEEETPVRNCLRYLSNRTENLDYASALRGGLPIGSGMIESGHRHVLHARLKKAGTAWKKQNANSLAQLRVLRANQQWETLWN